MVSFQHEVQANRPVNRKSLLGRSARIIPAMAKLFANLTRSELMSRIRGRGNKTTEVRLIAIFKQQGITGWRRHRRLPGRPDFVLPAFRLAIFVDGCFWHGCPAHFRKPTSNTIYWLRKIATNRTRDRRVSRILREKGWRVLRIWEHSLKQSQRKRLLVRLRLAISSTSR